MNRSTSSHLLIAGTASLGKLNSRKAIEAVVGKMVENGVDQFDTAPLYGSGCMETILGRCLKANPGVLINTKFGLEVPVRNRCLRHGYLASKVVQKIASRFSNAQNFNSGNIAAYARETLQRSSAILGLPIDVFFAHEVPLSSLDTDDFIRFVRDAKQSGLISRFGLGGYRKQYESIQLSPIWKEVDVVQVESLPGKPVKTPPGWNGQIFLHGVLSAHRAALARNHSSVTALGSIAQEAVEQQHADRLIIGFSRAESCEQFLRAVSENPLKTDSTCGLAT